MQKTILPLIVLIACGCAERPDEAPDDTTSMATYRAPDGSYSFQYPSDWSVEPLDEGGFAGTLLLAPRAEANWQANIFLEVGSDPERRALNQALDDLASNLPTVKNGFQLLRIDTLAAQNSIAGRIVYTHTDQGNELQAWELIITGPHGPNRLFVTAVTAATVKEKYLPIFERVVESITFTG